MKIGFFGTPDIAGYCFNRLKEEFEIVFLVAGDDKPAGRNLNMQCCPAKTIALEHSIPVFHPVKLTDQAFISDLRNADADLYVVVAYGRYIPAEVYTLPRLGTINLHPSLLPKYRGAAPIQWALINGEDETGITVQMINERLDAGDILLQKTISLSTDTTAGELYETVLPLGAEMLAEAVGLLQSGKAAPRMQNEDEATYCGKIDKELPRIKWENSARDIHNLVRGLNPRPGAWTEFRSMTLKIWKTRCFTEANPEAEPGRLMVLQKKRLLVGTGNGLLEILGLQPERKRTMDSLSFINGYRLNANEGFK